jgi:hypothetical protein
VGQNQEFLSVPTFSISHFQQQSWDSCPTPLPFSPDTKTKNGIETVKFWSTFVSVHSPAQQVEWTQIVALACGQLHPIALRFLRMRGDRYLLVTVNQRDG